MPPRTIPVLVLLLVTPLSGVAAQRAGAPLARTEVATGSELETYLRNLQVAGAVAPHPWSARRFTAAEVDRLLPRDTLHPWAQRYDWRPAPDAGVDLSGSRPKAALRVNSTFPFGYNDGAVWAGRGVTISAEGGVAARFGPFAATVAPLVSVASNAGFDLAPNGQTGDLRYADGVFPRTIDQPQRFGSGVYAQISAGQSVLEVAHWGLAAGASFANDAWGPAAEFPIILGNNAGGFPHVFLGTAMPVDLWLFHLHARTLFGRLGQSVYSPQDGEAADRYASAVVLVLMPRWPAGLEIGATRFAHGIWADRPSPLGGLFGSFGISTTSNDSLNNQLASVFARWTVPGAGVEIYGEYGTEDWRYDLREALVEPDHNAGFTVGLRQVARHGAGRMRVIRAELQNLQPGTLVQETEGQERAQGKFYTHGGLTQGHTVEGQLLGSAWGVGGAAAHVAVDWYHPQGRWTIAWSRLLRGEAVGSLPATGSSNPKAYDVLYTLGFEGVLFRGRYDLTAGTTAIYELNRDFAGDAFNLNVFLSGRVALW